MERRNTPSPDAVDVDAVRGVEILDGYSQVGDEDTRVAPRDEWVVEREIALGRAADDDAVVQTVLATTKRVQFSHGDDHRRTEHLAAPQLGEGTRGVV